MADIAEPEDAKLVEVAANVRRLYVLQMRIAFWNECTVDRIIDATSRTQPKYVPVFQKCCVLNWNNEYAKLRFAGSRIDPRGTAFVYDAASVNVMGMQNSAGIGPVARQPEAVAFNFCPAERRTMPCDDGRAVVEQITRGARGDVRRACANA